MATTMNISPVYFPLMLVVLFVNASLGFYIGIGGYDPSTNREPRCVSTTKPCRLQVNMKSLEGAELGSISTGTCSCNFPDRCPDDWTLSSNVVTRQVISTTYNITLEMMFCRPVEPKAFCRGNDDALVVKGSLAMPQDIVSYQCRCRDGHPLLLHERMIGEDHMIYHTYRCADLKRLCERTSPCMSISPIRTSYNCKCGQGFHCRTTPTPMWQSQVKHGYCSP